MSVHLNLIDASLIGAGVAALSDTLRAYFGVENKHVFFKKQSDL